MKFRTACAVLALSAPLALRPADNNNLRGFDAASQAEELKWEEQARAVPDAARVRAFIEKLSNQAHLAGTPQFKRLPAQSR